MASYAYTNPPTWFASGKNKDVVFAGQSCNVKEIAFA